MSMIVHDLRTCLTATLASLELLADGLAEGEEYDLLQSAQDSSRRMLHLVASLLEVRDLETGRLPVHLQPVDLTRLLQDVVGQTHALARQKGITLHLHLSHALPLAVADAALVSRVLVNLLDNALKATPPNGQVVVAGQVGEREVTVSVADSGPGIPLERRAGLFDPYPQRGQENEKKRGRLGLGLVFCKLAVEAQGGHIWVENGPGSGARFVFTLPLSPPPPGRPG